MPRGYLASCRDVQDWRVALSADLAATRGALVSHLDQGLRRTVLTLSLLVVATGRGRVDAGGELLALRYRKPTSLVVRLPAKRAMQGCPIRNPFRFSR